MLPWVEPGTQAQTGLGATDPPTLPGGVGDLQQTGLGATDPRTLPGGVGDLQHAAS